LWLGDYGEEIVVRSHQGFMPLNYEEGATSAAGGISSTIERKKR